MTRGGGKLRELGLEPPGIDVLDRLDPCVSLIFIGDLTPWTLSKFVPPISKLLLKLECVSIIRLRSVCLSLDLNHRTLLAMVYFNIIRDR